MKSRLVIALLLFFSTVSSFADEYADKLDALVNDYIKLDMFSGVVVLAKNGEVVYKKVYGFSDWDNKTPNTYETLFNICSINKLFTHATINQLKNEGKLSFDDPLNKYLPDLFPNEIGSKITIKMLIEMKAGLGDYLMDPNFNSDPAKFVTVNDYLELIKNEPLLFEPGTDRRYSNSGYAVLGGVIEKITGKSYEQNLKDRFFTPLGMSNSYYKKIRDKLTNSASGTRVTFSGKKMSEPPMDSPSPAGGIFTNAEDMLKFDAELRRSNIIGFQGAWAGGTQVWNAMLSEEGDYTLVILANVPHAADEIERRFARIKQGKDYPKPDLLPEMKFYNLLKEGGADALEKELKNILQSSNLNYNDNHLNMFGYDLMEEGETALALEAFKLNAKLFPDVPNVFDSMAEAYMKTGDNANAIKNYEIVLKMDPGNRNAKKMLDKLKK